MENSADIEKAFRAMLHRLAKEFPVDAISPFISNTKPLCSYPVQMFAVFNSLTKNMRYGYESKERMNTLVQDLLDVGLHRLVTECVVPFIAEWRVPVDPELLQKAEVDDNPSDDSVAAKLTRLQRGLGDLIALAAEIAAQAEKERRSS